MSERHAADVPQGWGMSLHAVTCEGCGWSYLLPVKRSLPSCPHCFQSLLVPLSGEVQDLPSVRPPEFVVPFALSAETLAQRVADFSRPIPFPPEDLNSTALRSRMQAVYLPTWLVDAEVEALWEAEAGFNYRVVSHEERYDDGRGGWRTREVEETRVRWEPRVGRLRRSYHNVPAPALEQDAALRDRLGDWDAAAAEPYRPSLLAGAVVSLPSRTPEDAWPAVLPAVRLRAAEECRRAADADHFRQFRWKLERVNRNWTMRLLPVYATYYEDDEGHAQVLLIHGRTGRVDGLRRGSMRRARRRALTVGMVALLMLAVSLVVTGAGLMM
ncbi:MAG: hypothetical protein PVI63_08800, partial [Anaerolineae bacterium]